MGTGGSRSVVPLAARQLGKSAIILCRLPFWRLGIPPPIACTMRIVRGRGPSTLQPRSGDVGIDIGEKIHPTTYWSLSGG